MLRYLQWLSVAGVWWPLVAVAAWFGLAWVMSLFGGAASGWGLVVGGTFLAVAAAHALAFSSLVGVGLLALRKAPRVLATAISALFGGTVATLVLGRVYLGVGA